MTPQLQLHYATTTTTVAVHHTTSSSCGWGDHCNHCNHSSKHNSNHLSVNQWLRSAIPDSQQPTSPIGFLFLKLPPPPCAVLLVITSFCFLTDRLLVKHVNTLRSLFGRLPKPEQPGICRRAARISGTDIRLLQPKPSWFQCPSRKMTLKIGARSGRTDTETETSETTSCDCVPKMGNTLTWKYNHGLRLFTSFYPIETDNHMGNADPFRASLTLWISLQASGCASAKYAQAASKCGKVSSNSAAPVYPKKPTCRAWGWPI